MFQSAILSWLYREGLKLGGIVAMLVTAYMQLDPASQATLGRIFTGHWRELPIGTLIATVAALWGLWQSYRNATTAKVQTKVEGKMVSIPEKKMADSTVEKVKASAGAVVAERKGTTLADIIGGLFKRN